MKRVKKPVFFVVALLILALVFTSLFGVYGQNGDFKVTYIKGAGDIRWGIDIRGGVEATFSPADGVEATTEELNAAKEIIETRMVSNSITDYEIYTDPTNNRIIVRFPWRSDEENFDPEEAINELAATAQLTFREGMEYESMEYAEDGSVVYRTPTGTTAENIILEGSDVVSATPAMTQDETTGEYQYIVSLKLSEAGAEKFAEATSELVGSTISIWMDDVMISYPTVNEAITNGECSITGDFTSEEATQLANQIQRRLALCPAGLQLQLYAAHLGTSAERHDAGGILAFVVISVLMIVLFRLPGVWRLSAGRPGGPVYGGHLWLLPLPQLLHHHPAGPGGHCALHRHGRGRNVISASRIREELRNGKSLDGALKLGFSESFWAIFDGNITTLIVAVMLMGVFGPSNILSIIFGESTTGAIFSFGFTLLVGIIGNFIMGMTATRLMTLSLAGFKGLHKKWLFGGARGDE